MKTIKTFTERPDYVFGSDELDTVLVWPDGENSFISREVLESGEIVEHRVYNWPIPTTGAEFTEIMENADPYEIESI